MNLLRTRQRLHSDMLPPSKVRKGKSRYKDIDDMEVLNQIYPPMCNIYKVISEHVRRRLLQNI